MEGPGIQTPQESIRWVRDYVRHVPDIRCEKVREMRRRISSGSWNPQSTRIAKKILDEHLFHPTSLG